MESVADKSDHRTGSSPSTRYGQKVMRLIFLGQAEGSGSGVSGPDGWWGMSSKRSGPAQLPLSLYRVRIACEVDSSLSIVSWVKMQHSVDHRYAIKFCVKLKKSATETLAMIQKAYGKDALLKAQVFRWHKAFREGREDVEDEQRIGRPSTSHTSDNVVKVKVVLDSDQCLSVRLIADQVGLPKSIVHEIVTTELQMREVCAKFVPKVLTDEQKEYRISISRELLDRVTGDPDFLEQVITGDETCVFEYDPETKGQSSEWHTTESPRPKKARMSKSKMKSMLTGFFTLKVLSIRSSYHPDRQSTLHFTWKCLNG